MTWLETPSLRHGLETLIDLTGITFRVDQRRFAAAADGLVLSEDFKRIASDLRLATELAVTDMPRLFDPDDY